MSILDHSCGYVHRPVPMPRLTAPHCCCGGALPPTGIPPIGTVLRGGDGEAFRRVVILFVLTLIGLLLVFGLPVPPA